MMQLFLMRNNILIRTCIAFCISVVCSDEEAQCGQALLNSYKILNSNIRNVEIVY